MTILYVLGFGWWKIDQNCFYLWHIL